MQVVDDKMKDKVLKKQIFSGSCDIIFGLEDSEQTSGSDTKQ